MAESDNVHYLPVRLPNRAKTPISEGGNGGGPMDPWQQTVDRRLAGLEVDSSELSRLMLGVRDDVRDIKATVPHLATKADVEKRPSRVEIWTMVGVLVTGVSIAAAIF